MALSNEERAQLEDERARLEAERERLRAPIRPLTDRLAEIQEALRPPPEERVILHYWHYGSPGHEEHDTVDDAVIAAAQMIENGTAAPDRIELPDGSVIARGPSLTERGPLDRLINEKTY